MMVLMAVLLVKGLQAVLEEPRNQQQQPSVALSLPTSAGTQTQQQQQVMLA
jgi:hypothetical protein